MQINDSAQLKLLAGLRSLIAHQELRPQELLRRSTQHSSDGDITTIPDSALRNYQALKPNKAYSLNKSWASQQKRISTAFAC
jgi:hypothetical protein